jgi:hypothetical protein
MHDDHGPRRLRQGNDTPEALLRAIDALRKGVDDGARLSRVGNKLESVLNAPPAAAGSAAAARHSGLLGKKLSTIKLGLGGLALFVVLTPLFFFRQHSIDGEVPGADRDGSSGATTYATELAAAPQPQTNGQADVAAQAVPQSVPQFVQENTAAPVVSSAEPAQPQRRSSKHAMRTREHSSREAPAELAPSQANEPVARNSATNAEASKPARGMSPSAASEPSQARKDPQRTGEKLQQPEDPPSAPAEADLLLKARKALKTDPDLALRLAAEHQSYYPTGRLVPEREVLAIEALRNLGRKPEADERLKKFEARYPKSIHLKRLHESP